MDDELDRLLALGHTSAPEQERMLERVLERSTRTRRLRVIAALAAIAACLPLAWVSLRWLRSDPSFTARGGDDGGARPVIDATCEAPCREGQRLIFTVSYLTRPAFFAAYAIAHDGSRVWYFPADDGALPELPASLEKQTVRRGFVMTPADVGPLEVRALLLDAPATRAEIVAGLPATRVLGSTTATIHVGAP